MGNIYTLRGRIGEQEVKQLRVGDVVIITGEVFTMRDQAHLRALEVLRGGGALPFDLRGGVIYHCGPLVKGGTIVSAGPTTSMRMEKSEGEIIARTGVRCIIGKGGMGTVYLAEREGAGFRQRVALKLLRTGWGDPKQAERMARYILGETQHYQPFTVR